VFARVSMFGIDGLVELRGYALAIRGIFGRVTATRISSKARPPAILIVCATRIRWERGAIGALLPESLGKLIGSKEP